jgi:protein-tyrosine-phosphatase
MHGNHIYVASAGIEAGDPDPFVGVVMDEIGLDLTRHRPHSIDDLADDGFDLAVALSPEAFDRATELAKTLAISVEYWPIQDPSVTQGSREMIMEAYRDVRNSLQKRVAERFEA